MNTESRRKAAAKYADERKAKGWAKVTVWLSPEALAVLPAQIEAHGSRDAALSAAVVIAAAPPVQDTKAGPVADYEGKQAERRSRERPKTLPPTLPAGDPVKAATKAPERAGGKFKGLTASGEELPERKAMQKSPPKGGKR